MSQPLIGITTGAFVAPNGNRYERAYSPNITAIARAGGLPVLIPSTLDESELVALYQRLDGLLIPGGDDINPARYGADRHPTTESSDDSRDGAEIMLIRRAIEDDRPILGICRGHQVFNVAMGGTLTQDIGTELPGKLIHDYHLARTNLSRNYLGHAVTVEPESHLAEILGTTHIRVNSLHHQAVAHIADAFEVIGRSEDGIVEALEVKGKQFAISVQWHPEDLIDDDDRMLRLFRALVACASGVRVA